MSSNLSTGLYEITNVALGQSPGHDDTLATDKPIIGTDRHPIWVVEHLVDNRYRLTLHGFVTKAQEGIVWSYLAPEVTGTEWAIDETEEGSNKYSILNPVRFTLRAFLWTLEKKDAQVTIEIWKNIPNQQWVFTPFVIEE
ncbi:hypothetical protein F5148DRAFT_1151758 [Russula earlei]|uniref:Uncharacterized protein n=1 Tax=Russula earlei TaxID=71964 RepID=A0ACC0U0G2_9AGAM|nr:hypothetical protein F5148DRAFT_1151758 [Russula earlei]